MCGKILILKCRIPQLCFGLWKFRIQRFLKKLQKYSQELKMFIKISECVR